MRRSILLVFASLFLMFSPLRAADRDFIDRVKNATALLYSQNEAGGMRMHCTVTASQKVGNVYTFVSAAHCIGNDDVQKERVAAYRNIPFYITFDESDEKRFYRAKVKSVGYQHRGDDFAEFEVTSNQTWPTIPIGDERKEEEGNAVLNIASPLGLGRQVFHGHISKIDLDRPIVQGDINWKGTVLLQMTGTNGGSSGSAVISEKQGAIVAFLVGTIGGTTITAIPASRFAEFKTRVAEKKYKWMPADEDQ